MRYIRNHAGYTSVMAMPNQKSVNDPANPFASSQACCSRVTLTAAVMSGIVKASVKPAKINDQYNVRRNGKKVAANLLWGRHRHF